MIRKLDSLHRCLDRVRSHCGASAEALIGDPDAQDIVSLNLTRAIQICVDIALHWLSEKSSVAVPVTMSGAFDALEMHGWLSAEVVQSMKKAVGFRNVAVHAYENVNWRIVHDVCSRRLVDFEIFAQQVIAALDLLDR